MAFARGGGGRGRGAGRGAGESAAPGLPIFCRPRHFVRGANVYSVPLWDLTSRWLPEELRPYTSLARGSAVGIAGYPTAASSSAATPKSGEVAKPTLADDGEAEGDDVGREFPDDDCANDGHGGAGDDDDDNAASDSEHSEIAWEGPLGHESRVWSRAGLEGGLLLLRRVAVSAASSPPAPAADSSEATPSAPSSYGLGGSSALFPPSALAEGADAPLDRRLAEVLRIREPMWAVCALRSGHFAGAIFKGQEALIHKAIHRYTIRAKSGGSQAAQDSSKKTKSAGSNLRRYGEQRLREEIKELMVDKWADQLAACELIFVSVSKRMRANLLGTEKEPFLPGTRVRKLPFMVGRPTFEAVREAYLRVASVVFVEERHIDALTARFRPAPGAVAVAVPREAKERDGEGVAAKKDSKAVEEDLPPVQPYREEEDELYTALHAAAAAGNEEQIFILLDEGADPVARDSKGRVPYFLAPNQRARDAFRRWRGMHEDTFDWREAQIPEGITDETEQRKKDKEKEKKKRQKEKQKVAKAQAQQEEEERKRKEEEEAKALEAAQAKCDSCKKPLLSRPFTRLNYLYCSPECVNAHRRELQAEAAMKRFGSGT
mmetsp:Transcript_15151/g.40868  ORF Transcript_15151/g.40868 Transcript_15151/m.40868 type:complete len:604 (+) Transcript_15151:83-1894(+)